MEGDQELGWIKQTFLLASWRNPLGTECASRCRLSHLSTSSELRHKQSSAMCRGTQRWTVSTASRSRSTDSRILPFSGKPFGLRSLLTRLSSLKNTVSCPRICFSVSQSVRPSFGGPSLIHVPERCVITRLAENLPIVFSHANRHSSSMCQRMLLN